MNAPIQQVIFRRNIRLAPYYAAVAGLLAVVPGFWTPLYLSYLLLAAIVGGIVFLMMWFGLRRRTYLGPFATVLMIFPLIVGRDILLPHDLPHGISFRCMLQAVGVLMFVISALHI